MQLSPCCNIILPLLLELLLLLLLETCQVGGTHGMEPGIAHMVLHVIIIGLEVGLCDVMKLSIKLAGGISFEFDDKSWAL